MHNLCLFVVKFHDIFYPVPICEESSLDVGVLSSLSIQNFFQPVSKLCSYLQQTANGSAYVFKERCEQEICVRE